ncbi:MAG: FliI/YscN family ATPase [Alphaproteobacteria bacterium]
MSIAENIFDEINTVSFQKKSNVAGVVRSYDGLVVTCDGFPASVGSLCKIYDDRGGYSFAELIGFGDGLNKLVPYSGTFPVVAGSRVELVDSAISDKIDERCLGRAFDSLLTPLDGRPDVLFSNPLSLGGEEVNPLERAPIVDRFDTGVRSINGLLTIGRGQRLGIMAGSGVGKSVLLQMITRHSDSDVIVVGLIGERSREIGDFINKTLTAEMRSRLCIIAEPAGSSPLRRIRAANMCAAISEYFRGKGKNTLLIMDSLTRVAHARREIGLSLGETPSIKGYPPSAIALIPELIERAGQGRVGEGSTTGIYTVLADSDDMNDPVVDSARAILDGHIILSRGQAELGVYPAIDISASISRVISDITNPEQQDLIREFRKYFSIYQENKDLLLLGGYKEGGDPELDKAIKLYNKMVGYIRQRPDDKCDLDGARVALVEVLNAS